MADNTTLNPGSGGDVIASDEISGVKYQRIKNGFGGDGAYVDVSSTDPLPVNDLMVAELLDGLQTLLIRLLNATNTPRGYDVALGRNRVTALLESGTVTTVGTVTTLGTVSNQTNMGGTQAQLLSNGQNVSAWAATVRSRIT
jgi:hypothetical protein